MDILKDKIQYGSEIILLFIFVVLTPSNQLKAQDALFTQFFASPLEINPALTGLTYLPKININYRNQWPALGVFSVYAISVDRYFEYMRSGIGLKVLSENSGSGIYIKTNAALTYSYNLRFRGYRNLRIGLEAGVINTVLDWDKLIFRDQLDQITGLQNGLNTSEIRPADDSQLSIDFGAGISYFTQRYYVGFSVKHLTRPQENFIDANDEIGRIDLRYLAHFGYNFEIEKESRFSKGVAFDATIMAIRQGNQGQINAGGILDLRDVYFGLHYRYAFSNTDALIGYLGYEYKMLKLGYSYDFTLSEIAGETGGTHEFSVIINFDWQSKNRININDCFNLFH